MKRAIISIIAAVLIGGLLGVGFFYATKAPEPKVQADPTPLVTTPVPITQESSLSATSSGSPSAIPRTLGPNPQRVTESFYNMYRSCITQGKASTDCLQNQYSTSELVQNVGGKTGTDPVLCSQNASAVRVDRETITGNAASAYAITTSDGTERQILVHLSNETGAWKVTNIFCPRQ